MDIIDLYRNKLNECRRFAQKSATERERDQWLGIAELWARRIAKDEGLLLGLPEHSPGQRTELANVTAAMK